jgi:hypothetical protein
MSLKNVTELFMWAVYLFEPLPHSEGAGFTNIIAYPLADGIALIVLGLLIGLILAKACGYAVCQQSMVQFDFCICLLFCGKGLSLYRDGYIFFNRYIFF